MMIAGWSPVGNDGTKTERVCGLGGSSTTLNRGKQVNSGNAAAAAIPTESATVGVIGVANAAKSTRRPADMAAKWAGLVAALVCGATALVAPSVVPATNVAPPGLYATSETLAAVAALTAAWFMRRRFLVTRRGSDLLLASAIFAFSVIHIATTAIPAAFNDHPHGLLVASDLYGELLVDAVIAAAAVALRVPLLSATRNPDMRLMGVSVGIVGAAAVVGYGLSQFIVPSPATERTSAASLLTVALAALSVGLLVFAAAGFARETATGRNRGRLIIACGLIAMAAAPPLLVNRVVGDDLSLAADTLQTIGFVFIAVAGLRWELRARRLAPRAAAIAERQRVARDLHDGLAQDLALIAAHGARMASAEGVEHPVVTAARRALQISRCAIAELSDPDASTVEEALEATATELRHRFGIVITLDVELRRELEPEVQEDVDRIAREAVANAVRHGGARTVVVSLQDGDGHMRLRVQDDGCGIDTVAGQHPDDGFGLRSIRQRAAAFGGTVDVRQTGTRGTVLDVVAR